ncbi:MAG TPA: hypothetical protein VER96_15085 [Polyangiaceae bacterium]|nr:hypothetical protein [Polyangiaceae bacterium]
MASTLDDAALDALAAALAPRLLREVRALLAADPDDDRALGVAALESIGFTVGRGPESSLFHPESDAGLRPKPTRKRSRKR